MGTPRRIGTVAAILVGVLLLAASGVGAVAVLSKLPDLRLTRTPAPVSVSPAFAAEVEARTRSADPARGKELHVQYGCSACHGPAYSTGPQLPGTGSRAATRRDGYSAPVYLYESIVSPNAFVVKDYPAGVMPQNFQPAIPEDQLYDLIAWLLTQ